VVEIEPSDIDNPPVVLQLPPWTTFAAIDTALAAADRLLIELQ
jgi:hypothetical protein